MLYMIFYQSITRFHQSVLRFYLQFYEILLKIFQIRSTFIKILTKFINIPAHQKRKVHNMAKMTELLFFYFKSKHSFFFKQAKCLLCSSCRLFVHVICNYNICYALKILLTKKQRLVLKHKILNFVFELNTKDGELSQVSTIVKILEKCMNRFFANIFYYILFLKSSPVNFFISSPQCYTCYAMLRMLRNVIVSF